MTRQEFIDGCLMKSAAAWVTDAPALLRWVNEVADVRAEHRPFDDDTGQATGQVTVQPETLYPWEDAPKDAKYATTDIDGIIVWWVKKPTLQANSWGTHREVQDFYICFGGRHTVSDWKNSLEKRPTL